MTRKKFIKRYMAYGMPRNAAKWLAREAVKAMGSYGSFAEADCCRLSNGLTIRNVLIDRSSIQPKQETEWKRTDLSRWCDSQRTLAPAYETKLKMCSP